MITVEIVFHSALQRFGPGDGQPATIGLQEGATLKALLEQLDLPAGLGITVFVNDHLRPLDTVLLDGSQIKVFPMLAGG